MKIQEVSINDIAGFSNEPFISEKDQGFTQLLDMIAKGGKPPLPMVLMKDKGGFEAVTGDRVIEAYKELGIDTVSVVVCEMTRDEAVIAHISEKLTVRDRVLPSEKARAYKMLQEAYVHQGKRLMEDGKAEYSNKKMVETAHECYATIMRYIRLNELVPELQRLVDEGRMGIRPAVEISYLSEKFQQIIYDFYETEQVTPSYAQAMKIRRLDKENNLDEDDIDNILSEEKANQKKSAINLSQDFCTKYFPKCRTRNEVESEILRLIRKLEIYEKGNTNQTIKEMAL